MKTIALIDHHDNGHHYTFIKLFAKYLLKLGYRVCFFYPDKEQEIKKYLFEEGLNLSAVQFKKIKLRRAEISGLGIFNHAFSTWILWAKTRRLLKQAERQFNIRFDIVFFAWLDDHLSNNLHHRLVDVVFPYRWSGLFFHPWYLNASNISTRVSFSSTDSVLISPNCISVGVHDEFNISILSQRIKKKVVLFPEIADSTEPNETFWIARQIKENAKGRMVVGLIGVSLRKGFPTFMEIVTKADATRYYFFLSGELDEFGFERDQIRDIRRFLSNPPANCFYYDGYINEGAELNGVIQNLNILFLVYNNFQSSSNLITKAALFKKLVLTTNRFWMGRATITYNLGATVAETDVKGSLAAMDDLQKRYHEFQEAAKTADYLKIHTEEILFDSFNQAFG